jgi:methionine aminotransferase
LSQGYPDFDCADPLKDLVKKYVSGGYNQYAPMEGVFALRKKISDKILKFSGFHYDPETEITITAGATQAIYTAITAFVREDDEVIIIEPAFDTYAPSIRLNGGRPVFVKLTFPDYRINWDEIQRSINSRTRMIILNTPHNPTGKIFSEEDLLRLQKITSGSKIIILSDEVYEHILFDGAVHQSVARFPELASRSLLISSFGKTYKTTGWKLGYCCAPAAFTEEFRKVHQFIVYAANTPIQHAYAEYMEDEAAYLDLHTFYQHKRDLFANALGNSRFELIPSEGTYFQLASYRHISEMKDLEFIDLMLKEAGVAAIPVSVFYHEKTDNKVVRFCFAKEDETLLTAAAKLSRL